MCVWCVIKNVYVNVVCECVTVLTSVVHVNCLGLTLCVRVNPIMKFIYTLCKYKCIIFIYIHVSVNVKYEKCKCKNKYILYNFTRSD